MRETEERGCCEACKRRPGDLALVDMLVVMAAALSAGMRFAAFGVGLRALLAVHPECEPVEAPAQEGEPDETPRERSS